MSADRHPSASKITRLRAQTRAIRWLNGLLLGLFGLSVGALAVASALPQKRQLEEKRRELARIEEKKRSIEMDKEDASAFSEALINDPELCELLARDRLTLRLPDETIYRPERAR